MACYFSVLINAQTSLVPTTWDRADVQRNEGWSMLLTFLLINKTSCRSWQSEHVCYHWIKQPCASLLPWVSYRNLFWITPALPCIMNIPLTHPYGTGQSTYNVIHRTRIVYTWYNYSTKRERKDGDWCKICELMWFEVRTKWLHHDASVFTTSHKASLRPVIWFAYFDGEWQFLLTV